MKTEQEIKEAEKYQDFFNFLHEEHNLIPTISEMDEIIFQAKKIQDKWDTCNCGSKGGLITVCTRCCKGYTGAA